MSERLEYIPDYTKTGKELLVDLLNYANCESLSKPLDANNIWFTTPICLPKGHDCNTAITISKAVGYAGWEYPTDIEYNRLDIYQLALEKGFGFKVYVDKTEGLVRTKDLLKPLFEVFKVKLIEEDIVDEYLIDIRRTLEKAVDKNELDIEIPFTLKISHESIAYYGELPLKILPRPIRLDTVIRKTKLPYSFVQIQRGGLS